MPRISDRSYGILLEIPLAHWMLLYQIAQLVTLSNLIQKVPMRKRYFFFGNFSDCIFFLCNALVLVARLLTDMKKFVFLFDTPCKWDRSSCYNLGLGEEQGLVGGHKFG